MIPVVVENEIAGLLPSKAIVGRGSLLGSSSRPDSVISQPTSFIAPRSSSLKPRNFSASGEGERGFMMGIVSILAGIPNMEMEVLRTSVAQ